MTLVADWTTLAADVRTAGIGICATANVPVEAKGFADKKVLALMLLARSMSNVKGALLLINAKQIVEARTITRCCLENLYWTVERYRRLNRPEAVEAHPLARSLDAFNDWSAFDVSDLLYPHPCNPDETTQLPCYRRLLRHLQCWVRRLRIPTTP
jgi:hypothetical protein